VTPSWLLVALALLVLALLALAGFAFARARRAKGWVVRPRARPAADRVDDPAGPAVPTGRLQRIPLYNHSMERVGYLVRQGGVTAFEAGTAGHWLLQLLARLEQTGTLHALGDRLLLLEVPWLALEQASLRLLPTHNLVFLLRDLPPESAAERLKRLQDQGVVLGLRLPAGGPDCWPLPDCLGYYRHLWLELDDAARAERAGMMTALSQIGARRLTVAAIGGERDLALARDLYASFLTGPLLGQAAELPSSPARGVPDSLRSLGQLVRLLRSDAPSERIEAVLRGDAMLSYRLLHHLNSPWFGRRGKVSSIRHALLLLGRDGLLRWLGLASLGGLIHTTSAAHAALYEQALFRARFMELLAEGLYGRELADLAYLVGAFSLLDRMLGLPMRMLLEELALPEVANAALRGDDNGLGKLLALASSAEGGVASEDTSLALDTVTKVASELGISLERVNAAWLESFHSSSGMLHDGPVTPSA